MTLEKSAVPAIDRADKILHILAESSRPVRPTELAKLSGLAKSTLYLLLDSLEQRHWIEKKDDGYIMGIGLYILGTAYIRHDGLQNTFRAVASSFVDEHNEVVQLAVLDGTEVVYLAREDARRPVRLVSDIGMRLPAHACALGKALLARFSDAEILRLLPARLTPISDRTITKRDLLLLELDEVRKTGLGRDREEVTTGLVCFAVYAGETPLGKKIAVSTSIPTDRLDTQREKSIIQGIVKVANQISTRLAVRY
jgi:DNA-binding IclR family transcriptional regulator